MSESSQSAIPQALFDRADKDGDGLTSEEAFILYIVRFREIAAKQLNHPNPYIPFMTLSIMAFHSEDGKPKFATDPDVYVPMEGGVASVEWLAEYLDNMNNFFRNGIAPEDAPEDADFFKGVWEVMMGMADMVEDEKLSLEESYLVLTDGLFNWLDVDDDEFVTWEEFSKVAKIIVEDAMKGRTVCKGIDIITETSGTLDVRMPLDDKAACGWLIMPKWFYAGAPVTCKDAVEKFDPFNSACPPSKDDTYSSDSCGNEACRAAISSIDDSTLALLMAGFEACAALPKSDPYSSYAAYHNYVNYGFFVSRASECGLDPSIVKLTPPDSSTQVRKFTKSLPHAATALLRRHEGLIKSKITQAARRLLDEGGDPTPIGSGTGGGSGGGGSGAYKHPFMVSAQVEGIHFCSGVLISPRHVLTTATCIGLVAVAEKTCRKDKAEESCEPALSLHGSDQNVEVTGLHLYPSERVHALEDDDFSGFDGHDIAILSLKNEVIDVQPVQLYDGRDLGISDCKKMSLGYASQESGDVEVQLVDHADCVKLYRNNVMVKHFPGMRAPDSPVSNNEICLKKKPATTATADTPAMNAGPCHAEYGLPLLAKVKGHGLQLVGLSNDDHMCDENLPAVFTRVSSYLQWIRATLAAFGPAYARHPDLTLKLSISQIYVPDGFEVKVYKGVDETEVNLVGWEQGVERQDMEKLAVLDSKCQASKEDPFNAISKGGAMFIMLAPSESGPSSSVCDAECVEMMGFTAKFGLGDGECIGKAAECPATKDCTTSVTWSEFGPHFEDKGKGYTGGLGKRMVKRHDHEYGVWACLRDWSPEEQLMCGTQIGELACFWFEEKKRKFDFQGLNSKTRLVTPAQEKHGKDVEDKALRGRTLATSPYQEHV